MICVKRLRGNIIYLNPDMIFSLETTPDTVLTLTNGEKLLLEESAETVVTRFMEYKQAIMTRSQPPSSNTALS